jgi:hypothetical protein
MRYGWINASLLDYAICEYHGDPLPILFGGWFYPRYHIISKRGYVVSIFDRCEFTILRVIRIQNVLITCC